MISPLRGFPEVGRIKDVQLFQIEFRILCISCNDAVLCGKVFTLPTYIGNTSGSSEAFNRFAMKRMIKSHLEIRMRMNHGSSTAKLWGLGSGCRSVRQT